MESLLLGIHAMGAAAFDAHEFMLTQEEAHNLAEATERVSAIYNNVIDPRIVAWVHLIAVSGMIYGPRVIVYRRRLKEENKGKKPAPVIPITPRPAAEAPAASSQSPSDLFGLNFSGRLPDFG